MVPFEKLFSGPNPGSFFFLGVGLVGPGLARPPPPLKNPWRCLCVQGWFQLADIFVGC